MKNTLMIFALLSLTSLSAFAGRLSIEDGKRWQTRIANQCEINFKPKHNNKAAVCDCVARNTVKLAEKESSQQQTLGLLGYAEKYYGLKLSAKELEKDPFYLDDFFQDVGAGCLKNSSYVTPRN